MNIDSNGEIAIKERIYLPAVHQGVDATEYLNRYIEREFPVAKNEGETAVVYSVPSQFKKNGKKQANLAEFQVFTRLHGLKQPNIRLWMTFFHSASYAGRSYRNQRIGKLMIREHDFVVFVKYNDKHYVALIEVKSSSDHQSTDLEKVSDSKLIKNNKRSAQHQLRDHMEILNGVLTNNWSILTFIFWPFLKSYTVNPKNEKCFRWREDKNLHVFEETISDQNLFNLWFNENILQSDGIEMKQFNVLLERFIIMSCGVFVNEINEGMMALLTQEQYNLLNNYTGKEGVQVVHGAAGTGKTLLVLRKLEQLHRDGLLDENNRALYICYWPGIRCEVELKLELMGLKAYVDTCRFYITLGDFVKENRTKYKHIFMDETEALCLAFNGCIIEQTLKSIYDRYHSGNCQLVNCQHSEIQTADDISEKLEWHHRHSDEKWGEFWLLVDSNQVSLFLPGNLPILLKRPSFILSNVMRSTLYIFNMFKQFYTLPVPTLPNEIRIKMNIPNITIGHHICGPPVYWADAKNDIVQAAVDVVVDLCATKGFQPKDLCVLPFFHNNTVTAENFNKLIDNYFVENSYRPNCIKDVEYFLNSKELNNFLIAWVLRVKGLEFKVVITVIDEDDFDFEDAEDRKKAYIIASRSTTMLIIISNKLIRDTIIPDQAFEHYPFQINKAHPLPNTVFNNFLNTSVAT